MADLSSYRSGPIAAKATTTTTTLASNWNDTAFDGSQNLMAYKIEIPGFTTTITAQNSTVVIRLNLEYYSPGPGEYWNVWRVWRGSVPTDSVVNTVYFNRTNLVGEMWGNVGAGQNNSNSRNTVSAVLVDKAAGATPTYYVTNSRNANSTVVFSDSYVTFTTNPYIDLT